VVVVLGIYWWWWWWWSWWSWPWWWYIGCGDDSGHGVVRVVMVVQVGSGFKV